MRKVVEGSVAIAEAIKAVRAQVIAAYPITPQTHIVQELSELVANGELNAEFVRVESEHSAASAVLAGGTPKGEPEAGQRPKGTNRRTPDEGKPREGGRRGRTRRANGRPEESPRGDPVTSTTML